MKTYPLATLLLLAGCGLSNSTAGSSSALRDANAAPAPSKQKILSCVDTATFADGAGNAHLIMISTDGTQAKAMSRPVGRALGDAEWSVSIQEGSVSELEDLLVIEGVVPKVDWETTDSCYAFNAAETFRLSKNSDGQWEGEEMLNAQIQLDPSVRNCEFPHPQPPRPTHVLCSDF